MPRAGLYLPGKGIVALDDAIAARDPARPVVPILFYRSMLLAADAAPIDALAAALAAPRHRGAAGVRRQPQGRGLARLRRAGGAGSAARLIVAGTAFASGAEPGAPTLFDRLGVPVLQAIVATTRREAWEADQRGLAPADLAMHVVLPELDGRIHGRRDLVQVRPPGRCRARLRRQANRPEPDRVEQVADRVAAFLGCRRRRARSGGWPC